MVKTLIFAKGQTREGMKWSVIDTATNKAVNFTGAIVHVIVYDAVDRTTIIIDEDCEILLPKTLGQCRYIPVAGDMDRVGTYEVELNPIEFSDGSVGILDKMQIVVKDVGPGSN